jgi:hypothetical protein
MQQQIKGLEGWVAFLGHAEIPVLSRTARELAALCVDTEKLSARGVARIIARDPMMTVKLLRYLQQHKHRSQITEVVQIEQALLMMGVEAFLEKLPPQPLIDELLHGQMEALGCLLRIVHRSHRASSYALDWAVHLQDMHYEEIRVAALLHDLAEMLMWCFAPADMLKIRAMQQQDKTLRSHIAQEQVLGFPLVALQSALAHEWGLPKLLLTLMDDASADQRRVRNVILAVRFLHHFANGWDDAALPDDFREIGDLLDMEAEDVMIMIGVEEEKLCDLSRQHS